MIVTVKRNRKQKIIKILSLIIVIAMFVGYYYHMSNEYAQKEKIELEQKQAQKKQEDEKEIMKRNFERAILSEIEKAVDLIGQENVRHVKLIDNKVIIICEPETNLDAINVRYGAMALTKKTLNELIIAIDINYIIESKLNAS